MPRFNHQAQIRRQRPIIRRSCRLVVFVRGRDVIGDFAGAFFDLAFVIGLGVVFVFFGHSFHFVNGVGRAD
jgi:hypothetical protein